VQNRDELSGLSREKSKFVAASNLPINPKRDYWRVIAWARGGDYLAETI
jgi:hypothetical protein